MKNITPLHKVQKTFQDYENEHGFEKTKAMVEMYSARPQIKDGVYICNDCGKPTDEPNKVRCNKCGKIVYIAVYGEERYNKYHNKIEK